MKKLYLLTCIIILSGCASEFAIKSSDQDKFADPDFDTFYSSNNRLTRKSLAGGTHIDEKGVFLNPIASRNKKKEGNPVTFGFSVLHYSYSDMMFTTIKEVIFLTDKKERIVVRFENNDGDFDLGRWNSLTRSYNSTGTETANGVISEGDFVKLCNSGFLEVKIVGGKKSLVVEKDDLQDTFIPNLKKFFEAVSQKQ